MTRRDQQKFKDDDRAGGISRLGHEEIGSIDFDSEPIPRSNPEQFVGQTIAEKYEILELIGQGGMSAVYRAKHLLTQKIVALKLMHSHLLADNNALRRFQQEAKAASRLSHPNAITVSDMGVTPEGQPFLTMDYLDGWSLSEVIKADGHVDVLRCLHIFDQTCGALAHAHEQGIIHRDLKPSNVMLIRHDKDPDFVKVVDFGIAKILPQAGSEALKLTTTGEVMGSPLYMSPEQCMGMPMDARSDIYSLGALMYETLVGKAPLEGRNIMETMYKQMNEQPPTLSAVDADVRLVKRLDSIIQKCMAKNPADRYASMIELQEDLAKSAKVTGLKMAATVGLGLTNVRSQASNKMGTSKKLVMGLTLALLAVIAAATLYFRELSTTTQGDPTPGERRLAFEMPVAKNDAALDKLNAFSYATNFVLEQSTNAPFYFYNQLKQGDIFLRAGRYESAIQHYDGAEEALTAGKLKGRVASDEALLHRGEALCYLALGKYAKAFSTASAALDKLDTTVLNRSATIMPLIGVLLESSVQLKNPAAAAKNYNRFQEAYYTVREQPADSQLNLELISTYPYATPIALRQAGDWVKAVADGERAEGNEAAKKNDAQATDADAKAKEQYFKAQNWYESSYNEWKKLEMSADSSDNIKYNEAVVQNDLGTVAMTRGELNKALEAFTLAQELIVQAKGGSSRPWAVVTFNIADVYRAQHKWLDAIKARANAQEVWTKYSK